jgi:hypothetical protein
MTSHVLGDRQGQHVPVTLVPMNCMHLFIAVVFLLTVFLGGFTPFGKACSDVSEVMSPSS